MTERKLNPEEIADKIEWEGGFYDTFVDYGLKTGVKSIDDAATALKLAADNLDNALFEYGVYGSYDEPDTYDDLDYDPERDM